jgi:hypothetical protein
MVWLNQDRPSHQEFGVLREQVGNCFVNRKLKEDTAWKSQGPFHSLEIVQQRTRNKTFSPDKGAVSSFGRNGFSVFANFLRTRLDICECPFVTQAQGSMSSFRVRHDQGIYRTPEIFVPVFIVPKEFTMCAEIREPSFFTRLAHSKMPK